jgi:hypothetical protein
MVRFAEVFWRIYKMIVFITLYLMPAPDWKMNLLQTIQDYNKKQEENIAIFTIKANRLKQGIAKLEQENNRIRQRIAILMRQEDAIVQPILNPTEARARLARATREDEH